MPDLHVSLRCPVCGSAELGTDEVVDRGLLRLAECRRCEHRWTGRELAVPGRAPVRVLAASRPGEEAAAAA
jgi:uncharacterized Zn finger protein